MPRCRCGLESPAWKIGHRPLGATCQYIDPGQEPLTIRADPEYPLIIVAIWPAYGPQLSRTSQSTHGTPQVTSSVSGNFFRRSCFRISALTCCEWSTHVRWCLSPSAAIVTQLVTRPPVNMSHATHVLEALSYSAMIATPAGPRAVSSATVPVRAGVALGLVVESDGGTTTPLAGCSTDQPASHGPRKHVATLSDRVLLNPEVAHQASVRTESPPLHLALVGSLTAII